MIPHKKEKLLLFSVLLSLLSIIITTLINIAIAKTYLRVDGKTRALFGITELLQFGYQYYVALPGIVSLILALVCLKSNSHYGKKYTAIILSMFALIIVFARIWRLFI